MNWYKSRSLLHSNIPLKHSIRQCYHAHHGTLEGVDIRKSAVYPMLLCQSVVKDMLA